MHHDKRVGEKHLVVLNSSESNDVSTGSFANASLDGPMKAGAMQRTVHTSVEVKMAIPVLKPLSA